MEFLKHAGFWFLLLGLLLAVLNATTFVLSKLPRLRLIFAARDTLRELAQFPDDLMMTSDGVTVSFIAYEADGGVTLYPYCRGAFAWPGGNKLLKSFKARIGAKLMRWSLIWLLLVLPISTALSILAISRIPDKDGAYCLVIIGWLILILTQLVHKLYFLPKLSALFPRDA